MQIIGARVLVSKVEEEQTEGFKTVEVQDSFVYKGKVEQIGIPALPTWSEDAESVVYPSLTVGSVVIFAKYSPDTQELTHEGKTYKVVALEDILAVI